jgi:hypothetical protein
MMLTLDNVADAAVPVTMEKWVAAVNDGSHEQVSPGKPYRIPDAVSLGDTVWQGDVGIVVCGLPGEGIPAAGDIGSFEYLGEKYTQCSPQAKAAKLVRPPHPRRVRWCDLLPSRSRQPLHVEYGDGAWSDSGLSEGSHDSASEARGCDDPGWDVRGDHLPARARPPDRGRAACR